MRVLTAGTIMVDILALELPKIADPDEVVYPPKGIETHIGGHPIDVAINLARLGANPLSIGVTAAIGEGLYGSFAKDFIKRYGIKTFFQNIPEQDTGTNIIMGVHGEERRKHMDPGANWRLEASHVQEALGQWNPDIFSLRPGYSGIDLDLEEILAPLKNTLVLLDIMQAHPSRPQGFLESVFPLVDILHCNEMEALVNTGAKTIEEAIDEFLHYGVKIVFVTSGEKGARLITQKRDIWQPGFRVDAVDATGCGDAFCAGIIHSLMKRQTFKDAHLLPDQALARLLLEGQVAGASNATHIGCIGGVSKEKTTELLETQGERLTKQTTFQRRG